MTGRKSKLIKAIAKCNCGNCKNARRVSYSSSRLDMATGDRIPETHTFKQCIYTHDKVTPVMACANWEWRG